MAMRAVSVDVTVDLPAQAARPIAVVVQVQLHFTEPSFCKPGETVEGIRVVLLARKEEAVARVEAVGVAKVRRHLWIAAHPRVDAGSSNRVRHPITQGLEVVTKGEHQVTEPPRRSMERAFDQVSRIAAGPTTEVFIGTQRHATSEDRASMSATPRTVA